MSQPAVDFVFDSVQIGASVTRQPRKGSDAAHSKQPLAKAAKTGVDRNFAEGMDRLMAVLGRHLDLARAVMQALAADLYQPRPDRRNPKRTIRTEYAKRQALYRRRIQSSRPYFSST